jgi:predicted nucleotidyltransferase
MTDSEIYPYSGNLTWLRERTILLVTHGSRAYGLNTPTSDVDIKGVAVPPAEYFLGFNQRFEQGESKDPDMVVYDVRKFFSLAADCNPNIIEVLWADEGDFRVLTPEGQRLREARKLFLSREARFTFSGYAHAQLKRIRLHHRWLESAPPEKPSRAEFGLPERTVIPADQLAAAQASIKKKLAQWNLDDMSGLDPAARIGIEGAMTEMLAEMKISSAESFQAASRAIGYDENFIRLLDLERQYAGRQRDHEAYQTWKRQRNPKRAELEARHGYDCYLDDTEFLTPAGWRRYDEIDDGTPLGTLNQQTGEAEFQLPLERVARGYSGPIVFVQTQDSDCAVTPNHRMWVSPAHRSSRNGFSTTYDASAANWHIERADALLAGKRAYFHVRVSIAGKRRDWKEVEDDYLILMGAYVSEGCVGKRLSNGVASVLRVSQRRGGRLCPYMEALRKRHASKLRRFTSQRTEASRSEPCTEYVYTFTHRAWAERIEAECGSGSRSKRLPAWVSKLSQRQARLLLDVLVAGDGTVRPHGRTYFTISKQLADDVQTLCALNGIASQLCGPYQDNRRPETAMYHVYVGQPRETATVHFRDGSPQVTVEQVHRRRIVCFTVPNEILITRRNGKVAIQGNTKHGMHLVRLMRMCREILETGEVVVKRPDRDELLAVRNGAWSYEQLIAWADAEEQQMDALYERSPLPRAPDRAALDRLCVELVEQRMRRG